MGLMVTANVHFLRPTPLRSLFINVLKPPPAFPNFPVVDQIDVHYQIVGRLMERIGSEMSN